MGFLQRFLSLGSRKNKKRRAALTSASTAAFDNGRTFEREQEMAANKLLRSSSVHFKVVSEADYSTLPPIRTLPQSYLMQDAESVLQHTL
jgi:hypothetical protein